MESIGSDGPAVIEYTVDAPAVQRPVNVSGIAWPAAREAILHSVGLPSDIGRQLPAEKTWSIVAVAKDSIADDLQRPAQLLQHLIVVAVPGTLPDAPQSLSATGHWYSPSTMQPANEATRFFVADTYTAKDLVAPMDVQGLYRQAPALSSAALVQVRGALVGAALPTEGTGVSVAAITLLNASIDAGGEIGVYSVPGVLLGLTAGVETLGDQATVLGLYVPLSGAQAAQAVQIASDALGATEVQASPREPSLPALPASDLNGFLAQAGINVATHRVPGFILAVQATPAPAGPHRTIQSMSTTPAQLVYPIVTEAYVTGTTVQTACLALLQPQCTELPFDVGLYDALNVTLQGSPAFHHVPLLYPTPRLGLTLTAIPMRIEGVWITKSLIQDALYARMQAWSSNHGQAGTAKAFFTDSPAWLNAAEGFVYVSSMTHRLPLHSVPLPIIQFPIQRTGQDAHLEWTPSLSPSFARYEIHRTTGPTTVLATITEREATSATLQNVNQYGLSFTVWAINEDGTKFVSNPQSHSP